MLRISCDVDAVTKIGYSSHPVFERSMMMEQPESKNYVVMNRKYFEGVVEFTAVLHHPTAFIFLVCHDATIPHSFRQNVPDGAAADSRPDSGTGSRLFEVNIWMWRYGRAFPRKISVEDAEEMRRKRVQESRRRGAETLKRRRLAGAARQAE